MTDLAAVAGRLTNVRGASLRVCTLGAREVAEDTVAGADDYVSVRANSRHSLPVGDLLDSNGMDPSPLYGIECQTGVEWIPVNERGEVANEAYSGRG